MTVEVHKLERTPPQHGTSNGGRNGRDIHGRVSAIEARLDYLATKEDIQRVEKVISDRESSMQRWLIGILLATIGTTLIALYRTFS